MRNYQYLNTIMSTTMTTITTI